MKKILTLIVALIVFSAANAQVLFEISGNGLKQSSYILGSCHVVTSTFVDSIPGAHKTLKKVSQICGEIDSRDMQNPDTLLYVQQKMMLGGDSTLRDFMTDEQFNQLCKSVYETHGIDLTEPQFAGFLKLRPLFFSMTIAVLGEQLKAINSGTSAQQGVLMDMYFQQEALKAGKPCIGLESTKFQMDLLVTAMDTQFSFQEQVSNMIEGIGKLDSAKTEVYKLVDVYKSMDVKKLEDYFSQSMKDSKDAEALVFDTRNKNWSNQMPAIMADRSTLFVVGEGHLVGPNSVLSLLKAKGYKIKGVRK